MARKYGKLYVNIWADPDFIRLPADAQRLYLFLISQPDLTVLGTITMALNRWATRSADTDRDSILNALSTLAENGFVIVDELCEEVLVRSYIRHDEGWRSPNMMTSIAGNAQNIMSETIRASVRDEVMKIDTDGLPTKINERTGRSTRDAIEQTIREMLADLDGCEADPDVLAWSHNQPIIEGLFDAGMNPLVKGFVTTTTTSTSTSTTPTTTTTTHTAGAQYSEEFESWWAHYPVKKGKKRAYPAFKEALKRAPLEEITDGAVAYAQHLHLNPDVSPKYAEGWLNDDRWTDEHPPPRQRGPVTTDRMLNAIQLGEQLQAEADAQARRELTA